MTDNTLPTADELRAISNRGRDAYSLATDDDWSERESSLAAYEALYAAGRVAGLEEAATVVVLEMAREELKEPTESSTGRWHGLHFGLAAIRARLGDTG